MAGDGMTLRKRAYETLEPHPGGRPGLSTANKFLVACIIVIISIVSAVCRFSFVVVVTSLNRPPTFVSLPVTRAVRLQSYLYDSDAIDPMWRTPFFIQLKLDPPGWTSIRARACSP